MDRTFTQILHLLNNFAANLSGNSSIDQLVEATKQILKAIFDIENSVFFLHDRLEGSVKIYAKENSGSTHFAFEVNELFQKTAIKVYTSKQPASLQFSDTITSEASLQDRQSFNGGTWLFIPMLNGENGVGAIGILKDDITAFSEEKMALLSLICNMAGSSYANLTNCNLLECANNEIADLSKLATESPNPVMRISFAGILIYANNASQFLLNNFGLKVGDVVTHPLLVEMIELGKNGKSNEIEIEAFPTIYSLLSATSADYQHISIYGRDITKRKELENELNRLALVAKETENAVVLSDGEGKIVWANGAFSKLSGYELNEILGRKPAEFLVGPDTDKMVVEKIADAIRRRETLEVDVVNYNKSQKKYWIKLQIQPAFRPDGEFENYISIQKEITRQKEIEHELIQTTNFQKAILNSSAIAIISTNLEGVIQSFNPAATAMFGYQPEEVIGIASPLLFHDKTEIQRLYFNQRDRSICYFGLEDLNQCEDSYPFGTKAKELTCQNKNGNQFTVSLTITALRDEKNDITGFLGMAKDTTERNRQIEELKIANLRFRSLISSMQAAVMVEDENRKIILVNQIFCTLFNIPLHPDQLIGYDCSNAAEESKMLFTDPDQFIRDINNTLIINKVVSNFELSMVNGNSLERDYIPLEDNKKKNHGILWIYRDVTTRKKNETELKRQSQILSGTAKAMNYLLTLHDHDLAIQKALETIGLATGVDRVYIFGNNEDAETGAAFFSQQFEWSAEGIVPQIGNQELQNMPYSEQFPGWYNSLKAGKTVSGLTKSFPDKERIILEDQDIKSIIAAPIFVQDRLWGMVGFDDCTRGVEWSLNELSILTALAGSIGGSISKQIVEEELIGARQMAEYATKTKSEFLATMSHEIRTPMNGVIGMTSLLLQTPLSNDQRDYAETIKISGELLLDVINDILDFSKIESGKMILEEDYFDLRMAIEDVLDLVATSAHEKRLGLFFEVDKEIPSRIRGDLTRLRQILVNLTGNAIKFTGRGEILIEVKQVERMGEKSTLRFSVKDTGVGIPGDKIDLLFKPFSQVDASTTRKFGGTGLGLAICAKLVGLMHGKIWVESEVGIGTAFFFTIQTNFPPEQAESPEHQIAYKVLKGRNVLVIDANPVSNKIINALLTNHEVSVQSAFSIEEALPIMAANQKPELIVLDNEIPASEIAKFTVDRQKYNDLKNTPTILLTDPGMAESVSRQDFNVIAKVNKPLKHSLLLSAMKKSLSTIHPAKQPGLAQQHPIQKIDQIYPLNILVAEDNAINQKLINKLFEMLGYKIQIAANGFEVINTLNRMRIDIIFMDIQMPEMDGLEATKQIIHQWGDERPLIVAMTANALYTDKDKCLEAGMDDYISKPLTISQVKSGIERWSQLCKNNL